MARSKSILFITFIWLVVLLSGCVDEKNITAVPTTPAITTNVTSTPSTIAPEIAPTSNGLEKSDLNGTIIVEPEESPTPAPSFTASKEALSTALYVTARMKPMSNWSSGNEIKYELNWLKVYILNQQNNPLSITTQIISGDRILEEKSFVLDKLESSIEFSNEKNHFVNSTNVTLRVLIKGYPPKDYPIITVDQLN